jgi:cytochrome c556
MKKNLAAALALAMGVGIIGAGAGLAAGSADDMINARQAEMKVNMKAMKALVSMLKGETPYDTAAVQAAAKSMTDAQAEGVAKDVWNASSQTGATVKSGAKPEIWTDGAGFTAAWKDLDTAVAALAASKDEAAFKAAFPAVGAACKGCHEKFRAAEQ